MLYRFHSRYVPTAYYFFLLFYCVSKRIEWR